MLVDIRHLTVEEYHRLGEMGIIDPDEKVELIAGQIIKKPVKGTPFSPDHRPPDFQPHTVPLSNTIDRAIGPHNGPPQHYPRCPSMPNMYYDELQIAKMSSCTTELAIGDRETQAGNNIHFLT